MPPGGQIGQSDPSADPTAAVDLRLVTRAVAGDPSAFEELYRRHAPLARRVAWSVLHNESDAEDVVADAFERLLRVLPADRLHDRRAFRGYLLVATKNLALNAARLRQRHPSASDDGEDRAGLENPLDEVVDHEEIGVVRRAFRALPERWRSVLWLTEVEGLSHKAAAELLGVSPNSVSHLAMRARAGLRETFLQASSEGPTAEACRFTRERLAAHAGGALPAVEAAQVEEHLATCASCRARFAEVVDLASTLRHVVLPVGLIVSIGRGTGRLLHETRIGWRAARAVGIAATAVAVVVGGVVLVHRSPAPPVVITPVVVAGQPVPTTKPTTSTTGRPQLIPATSSTTGVHVPVTTPVTVKEPDDGDGRTPRSRHRHKKHRDDCDERERSRDDTDHNC